MQPFKARLLACGATIALAAAFPTTAQDQDTGDEGTDTIIVTGSLIERSDYQLTSPIDVVGRTELEAKAPLNMAEFVRDLPYNFGSAFSSGRAFGNERGAGTINLRGLGASATLVLVNGRRQTQLPDAEDAIVDINSLIPEIMLERIEILKDGASATYGSDAIAGVANFITRDNFEGVEVSGRYNTFTFSDVSDYRIEALVGSSLGNVNITGAIGYYDQQPITSYADQLPSQDPSSAFGTRFSSSAGVPGEFVLPVRDEAGAVVGSVGNIVDPECGNIASSIPTVGRTEVGSAAEATDCRYNFWADNAAQSEIQRFQGMFRANGDVTDRVRFDSEFGYSYTESATNYTAGDTVGVPVVIPGHNPGNIYYRATDANGAPLFAVSSGVSAGYVRDGEEVFIPLRDANGSVVLTDTPTDAASGIPFYEDVVYSGRLVNSQGNQPTNNSLAPGAFSASRPSVAKNHIMRVAGGLTGDLTSDWQWRAGVTYSRYTLDTNGSVGVGLTNELNEALAGFGGANCNQVSGTPGEGGCFYFNPFGNSAFATPGEANANSSDVLNFVFPKFRDQYESDLMVADLVVAGTLAELPAGPLGVAAGYQRRRAGLAIDYDASANSNNRTNGVVAQDFDESRSVDAFFAEASVPLFNGDMGYAEFTGAVRHEKIGDNLDTTDPKVGFRYQTPNDMVELRASYGTSFIAPSLFRQYAVAARGTAVNDCPVEQGPPCTGEQNLRILLYQNGNLDLRPETSKAWSAGMTARPLENLTLDATWWRFDFEDKIATQTATAIINENPNGTEANPVVRDANNRIVAVTTRFFNQASVVTDGIDLSATYNFDLGSRGDLALSVAGTHVFKYDTQASPTSPVVESAGASNDRRLAPPNADVRINGRATWSLDNHMASVGVRYYGPLEFTLDPSVELDSWTPVDLNYSFSFDALGQSNELSIGAINVFDAEVPEVPFPGFQPFIPRLYDVRGRSFWVKATTRF